MAPATPRFPDERQPLSVRVCIAVPPEGCAAQLARMQDWLDAICGPVGWATAPAGLTGVVNDAIAFYFADEAASRAFIRRFACGYRTSA